MRAWLAARVIRGIVPDRPSLPIQPLLLATQDEPGMVDFFKRFPWFLRVVLYNDPETLVRELQNAVIEPAEAKWREFALHP